MTVRGTILGLLAASGIFALTIGIYVSVGIVPDARQVEDELVAFGAEIRRLGASRDALDASLREAHSMVGPEGARRVVLADLRESLPGTAAMRSAIVLQEIPPEMRLALGSAAESESRLQNLLLEFVSHLELRQAEAAEVKLARADSVRAVLDGHLARVTGFAVDDLLTRQSGVSTSARRLRDTAVLWVIFTLAAIPGAWILLHRRLNRPLAALDAGFEEIASGSFPVPLDFARGDEMGRLAVQFNRVVGFLREEDERTRDEIVRWEHIFDHAAFGITIADPKFGQLLKVNPAYADMVGRDPEEMRNSRLADLCPSRLHDELAEHHERVYRHGSDIYETVHLHGSGTEIPVQVDASVITRDGQPAYLAAVVQDITGRRKIEAERERMIGELEIQNEELERFSYTVSHDLRAPLVTIRGFLGLVQRDAEAGDQERLQADLGQVKDAANRMGRLLDELLELSRVGRLDNPPEATSVTDLADEAVALVTGSLTRAGAQTVVHRDLPPAWGDRMRLVEVFQNLVENAAKFASEAAEPRIEVGAAADGNLVRCYVRDNGLGIEPQYQDKIFDLFDRLDPDSEGTGIGLAIVKRVVEHHGGRVWVESEGRGHGSTFWLTLPGEAHSKGPQVTAPGGSQSPAST